MPRRSRSSLLQAVARTTCSPVPACSFATPPGREIDYHPASRRQYVITLSGHAELVLSGGQTIQVGPGSIELAEDTTGKGHITRTVGTEDRVVILIPISGP
jgi:hypothetical protein